ncbi:FAD/NAD(P)-binding domain-containing protein [Cystobasidium minutum MCA 4210]|uniref:FAD/NAD(P)-binding domain-containing protein n=1 Tax=Cystobasidium minutum MCA 4210 TaxID=1397322 RepID=UPI0034CED86C|eukprot:jgi/Rhomi1/174510/fgenesh1_kg.8_\
MVVSPQTRKKRVAIIGSGLAGLSAAHLLLKKGNEEDEDVEVHIFEKAASIGMDSASIDVVGADGKVHRVDSPMRAVQGGYYTRLLKLYRDIGVQLEKSNFTYSFFELSSEPSSSSSSRRGDRRGLPSLLPSFPRESRCQTEEHTNGFVNGNAKPEYDKNNVQTSKKTTFIYNGGNGLNLRPVSFPSSTTTNATKLGSESFSIMDLLDIFYYIYDIVHVLFKASFFASCYIYLALLSFYHVFSSHTSPTSTHPLSYSTLASFLSRTYIPRSFIVEVIVPLFSCVATCSTEEVMAYPAGEILEYIARTFGTDHYVVKGGVRNVLNGLLKDLPEENIHLGCELVSLRRVRRPNHASHELEGERRLELKEASGQTWHFDDVIFATQANQARFLLADYYKSLRDSEHPLDGSELNLEKERLDALGKFSYTTSIVINHYDEENTLVEARSDRRILNLGRWSQQDIASSLKLQETKLDRTKRLSKDYIMATHDLSILHPDCRSPSTGAALLQTTNPTIEIKEDNIVSSQVFERAIMTLESKRTLKTFMRYPNTDGSEKKGCEAAYQGLGGIWFVGSWAAEGIPLLEGCVVSAERAVEAIRAY